MDAIKRLFETQPLDSRWVSGLALAQGCAFLTALSATASTALANRGASAPAWQSFFIYVLLGGFYVPYHARQKSRESEADDASGAGGHGTGFTEPAPPPPSSPPLSTGLTPQGTSSSSRTPARYALLAFIDTQANYWIVKAFRYTSLTSVTLLDCAAVPFSMALSIAILGSSYSRAHIAGGALSFCGLALLVLTDTKSGGGSGGSNPPLGDFMVIVAAALYASSNVLQERALLEGASTSEVLAAIGGMGAVISGIQCAVFELKDLSKVGRAAGAEGFLEMAAFAGSLFAMYSLVPEVLRRSGSAAFNVGMLSSDLWAVLARVVFFAGFTAASFLSFAASFVLVAFGTVVFASAGDPLRLGGERRREYEVLDEDLEDRPAAPPL